MSIVRFSEIDKAPKDRLSARFPELRGAMALCPVSTCEGKPWPVDTIVSQLRVYHQWAEDAILRWLALEAECRMPAVSRKVS